MGKSKELAELGDVVTQSGGNVGIGTSSPENFAGFTTQTINGSTGSVLAMQAGGVGNTARFVKSASLFSMEAISAIPLLFSTNNTERMRIDASGRVTMPYQPCFMAQYTNNPNVTSGWKTYNLGIGVASHARWNVGGHYSTSTGRFTAPVTGYYQFDMSLCAVYPAPQTNYLSVELWVNGGRYAFTGWNNKASGYYKEAETFVIPLNAGDYVEAGYESAQSFQALGGTGGWYTYFSGHLIG